MIPITISFNQNEKSAGNTWNKNKNTNAKKAAKKQQQQQRIYAQQTVGTNHI